MIRAVMDWYGRAWQVAGIGLVALANCGSPLILRADYRPVGLNTQAAGRPIVPSPAEVLVFHQNAPDGFTLRENELSVEPGFQHRILGPVEVRYDRGHCNRARDFKAPVKDLEWLIRHRAHSVGANAVIYYVSELAPGATWRELKDLCMTRAYAGTQHEFHYARGWAVVLSDARPPAKAPAPAPAPALPAPSCTPGETQACVGPGACKGAQVCQSGGQVWGPCDCGEQETQAEPKPSGDEKP